MAKPVVNINQIIPCTKFSCFDRLIRVTSLVLKFLRILLGRIRRQCDEKVLIPEIVSEAKMLWVKETQRSFENDRKFADIKKILRVFSDSNGILRVGGRIENAPLPYETRYPILLPREHHLTRLIVRKSHETVKHNGVRETLNELRSEFWINKCRQTVKSILSKCVTCKEITGKPYGTPIAPPLPPFRVSEDAAFSQIGIDFAGPLYVRGIYVKEKQAYKCYIALFSCCSTRAIHLELTPDLQGSTFVRTLKRFISRRGIPARSLSDNGSTFIDYNVQTFVASKGITWQFNVPTASWLGGLFEIMVKLTKLCLRKTLKNAYLRCEELETVLIETEAILNSRPLTFLYEDVSEPPLTPSCLVMGRRLLDKHEITSDNTVTDKIMLNKRAKYLETLLSRFFTIWKREYLTSLRERFIGKNQKTLKTPKRGDVVIIQKEKTPRQKWKLGKITELLTGRDKIVRAVEVRTTDNSGRSITVKRPIQKLVPIEVQDEEEHAEKEHVVMENEPIKITMVRDENVVSIKAC